MSLVISLLWVFVTFLRFVFGNVLVTSAWKRSTGLFTLIIRKAKILHQNACAGTALLPGAGERMPARSGRAGDIQRPPTVSHVQSRR